MFSLSPTAATALRDAIARSAADGQSLRIAARTEVDGSLALGMGFDDPREGDMPLEIDGVALLIGKPSQPLLEDALLDFVEVEPGRRGFVCVPQASGCATASTSSSGCASRGCSGCG
jgi:iron-sulfur cluster assembly protein